MCDEESISKKIKLDDGTTGELDKKKKKKKHKEHKKHKKGDIEKRHKKKKKKRDASKDKVERAPVIVQKVRLLTL